MSIIRKPVKNYDYAICSGYFDPLHGGHLDLFDACKELGRYVWVILNNDAQLKEKKRIQCFSEDERYKILSKLKSVDYVTISYDRGPSVEITLQVILNQINRPLVPAKCYLDHQISKRNIYDPNSYIEVTPKRICFVNSGDRNQSNASSKEEEVCKKHHCDIKYINLPKTNSSSLIIKNIIKQYENTVTPDHE